MKKLIENEIISKELIIICLILIVVTILIVMEKDISTIDHYITLIIGAIGKGLFDKMDKNKEDN